MSLDTREIGQNKVFWIPLVALAAIKLAIHSYANLFTGFGLHRDEYLYIAEGDHLQWGYMEGPPMIAVMAKFAHVIFGNSMFGIRLLPALLGALTIIMIGIIIKELGGRRHAQVIGAFAFLTSLAFLGSNNLFQPVSFNQFCWFLTVFMVIKIISYFNKEHKHSLQLWVGLGFVIGLALLTKYSIIFFITALLVALLISPYRKLFLTKYPYIAFGIAIIMVSPNIWWQIDHDFPVLRHMSDLSETQLVNVSPINFLLDQCLSHFGVCLIWIPGLIFSLFHKRMKDFRFIGIAYLLVISILISLSGKGYYAFGAYPMLFVMGGLAWEHWLKKRSFIIIPIVFLLNLGFTPMVLPILPVETMVKYSQVIKDKLEMTASFRWEDGEVRNMRQDYADMLGWDEIPEKVANIYHSLPEDKKSKCLIWGGNYGHAGVLNFERQKYNLPPAYSFNASFVNWVPEELEFEYQIQVEDNKLEDSPYFESTTLIDSITHPYARDPGYIYLKSGPKQDLRPLWKQIVKEEREAAGYK